ncbi:xylulokinase [Olivibacter sitiensis]|uniref:xylulokinase n=1 Tax=Olivibacter sitiensis TaxID=376470 RepID=UPI000401E97E|nr:FGGY family carbohydrate kinase [Olivibacter sitiensis]
MLSLGIDLGTSSVKVSILDTERHSVVVSVSYPEQEREIKSLQPGWAEQDPRQWWSDVKQAIGMLLSRGACNPRDIKAIGIAYQMHGLVLVDENLHPVRDAIIWCDSRAVPYGQKAFDTMGHEWCLSHLLNSPGNFTAAKLAWVKENEPQLYKKAYRMMLPGDYIGLCLTGQVTATKSMLSEGILWNFRDDRLATEVLDVLGLRHDLIPYIQDVFSIHGELQPSVAEQLGLPPHIPVSYKAGDQPNNALSLGVLHPGEIAANAGTSGVLYAVTGELYHDKRSRVNAFAHVNHTTEQARLGVLLCLNGTGIANKWIKDIAAPNISYEQMNGVIAGIPQGSEGLLFLPFGNGAERVLENKQVGAQFIGLDFNQHSPGHLFRAVHEGIAYSFRYGLNILQENGLLTELVKAGKTNMFLSESFAQTFVDITGLHLQLYHTDGSVGAAIGAAIGVGHYRTEQEAFAGRPIVAEYHPEKKLVYEEGYGQWSAQLDRLLHETQQVLNN